MITQLDCLLLRLEGKLEELATQVSVEHEYLLAQLNQYSDKVFINHCDENTLKANPF